MIATLLFSLSVLTPSSHAMFIDRFVDRWKHLRAERYDLELRKLPLFQNRFLKFPANNAFAAEGTFNQKLNHFDPADPRSFSQRYWVNSTYASSYDAPVIYSICGESRCSPASGFEIQLAKELHAYSITLEHRYYGDSVPVKNYDAEGLKYLSVDQALADLDAFQTYVKSEKKLTGAWISVGGSYSGALSAYYRLAYPTKIAGALASSAPVEAKASFEDYDYQVASVVSSSCRSILQQVTREIEIDLQTRESRSKVKALFGSEEIIDDVDFLYIVADMAAIAIQYGSRETFCSTLENASDPKSEYARMGLELFSNFGITPIEDTAQGNLSTDPNQYRNSGMRQWLYQSCAEFGYWQIAFHDPKFSARSPRIDLPFHNSICRRMFGMNGTVDTRPINSAYFGPLLEGQASKIFFTNGSDDPWQHLSITPARGNVPRTLNAALIQGAAHCDDLQIVKNPNINKTQNTFRALLKTWLEAKGYSWH